MMVQAMTIASLGPPNALFFFFRFDSNDKRGRMSKHVGDGHLRRLGFVLLLFH